MNPVSGAKFDRGDRVVVTGPPRDVEGDKNAHKLFKNLIGTVSGYAARGHFDPDEYVYLIKLDEDLRKATDYGWITNNYTIPEMRLQSVTVPQEEIDEVIASIQASIQNTNAT